MNLSIDLINTSIFKPTGLKISAFEEERESKEYDACRFDLNGRHILYRNAKTTPKKSGQFVTFWKRNTRGIIEPFDENDQIDYYVVTARSETRLGQFVFPKSFLIEKRIISSQGKEGKRAFRVYPDWDNPPNAEARKTQLWQSDYFYEIEKTIDVKRVRELYGK